MRSQFRLTAVLVTSLTLASTIQAQPKDVAELFPAKTLAYLELRKPEQFSKDLHGLMKGSYLDDLPARFAQFREKADDAERRSYRRLPMSGPESMLITPETFAELGRIQGGAIAFTGFNKNNYPEVVGVVLAGESNGPTFIMRVFLTAYPFLHKVAEVEGIVLYREREPNFGFRADPAQPAAKEEQRQETGAVFALLPRAVVIGSTVESVKDVVLRIKNKPTGPSLAGATAFKDAGAIRDRAGLFAYGDMAVVSAQMEEFIKRSKLKNQADQRAFAALANLKSLRKVTASLSLQDGNLELVARVAVDPKQSSPLLDLLPDTPIGTEALHFVPKDAICCLTMSLTEGEKRWEKLLALLDSMPRATVAGDETLPSKAIAEAEKQLNVQIGKEVMSKLRGVTVVVQPPGKDTKAHGPTPMLLVSTADNAAAKSIVAVLPKLMSLANRGDLTQPSMETIKGQEIYTGPFGGSQMHYGIQGNVIVLGLDRQSVATALVEGSRKNGLIKDTKVAAAVKGLDRPVMIGVASLGKLLEQTITGMRIDTRGAKVLAPGSAEKYTGALIKAVEPLPPAILTVTRKPDELVIEVRQTALKAVSAKVINGVIDGSLDRTLDEIKAESAREGKMARPKFEAPPPPPPID